MKNIGLIGLIIVLLLVFAGFWLYRSTTPEPKPNTFVPSPTKEGASIGNQFLQLIPSAPPITITEDSASSGFKQDTDQTTPPATSTDKINSPSKQVQGVTDQSNQTTQHSLTAIDQPGVVISMTDQGIFPGSISVKAGTTVTFVNDGQASHWPASDPHPAHDLLSGFDASQELLTGESYSYQFNQLGEWTYHDHLYPNFTAVIVVK